MKKTIRILLLPLLMIMMSTSVTSGTLMPFTDYGSGSTVELVSGAGTWNINWGQGPWVWFASDDPSLFDANVDGVFDVHATAPADIDDDLIATLPVAGTLTIMANANGNSTESADGMMVLSGSGVNVIDLNAERAFVDQDTGILMVPFRPDEPKLMMTLDSATGIFEGIEQVGEWELYWAGWYAAPLVEGLSVQDNIFAALGGQVPVIGGVGEFVLTGEYVPEPATVFLLGLGSLLLLRRERK